MKRPILKLKENSKENISINTFGDKKKKSSTLSKVGLKLKNHKRKTFEIEALCTDVICLPIRNQPVLKVQNEFSHLKGLNSGDSGVERDIDLLIGSDWYWSLVTGQVKVGRPREPVALKHILVGF